MLYSIVSEELYSMLCLLACKSLERGWSGIIVFCYLPRNILTIFVRFVDLSLTSYMNFPANKFCDRHLSQFFVVVGHVVYAVYAVPVVTLHHRLNFVDGLGEF